MAKKNLTRLIELQSQELQWLKLTETRAAELAEEVAAINDAVFEAALEMDFDDEPAAFRRRLAAAKPAGEDTP